MSLDALRDLIPAYAKDISLNLSSLASETVLNDQQKWGCFLASAHAVGTVPVVRAIEAAAAEKLTAEALNAARVATSTQARKASYDAARDVLADESPLVYLYHQTWIWAHNTKLEGFTPYPDGMIRLEGVTWTD